MSATSMNNAADQQQLFAPDPSAASAAAPKVKRGQDTHLWEADTGTLTLDARRATVKLITGPYVDQFRQAELWAALLEHRDAIAARLSDLLLELVIDEPAGIAFVKNAPSADFDLPSTVRQVKLTLIDTIMALTLRRELLMSVDARTIVGRDELMEALTQYRPLYEDESSFKKKVEASIQKFVKSGILLKGNDNNERFEVSPALKIIFGTEEARAAHEAIEAKLAAVTGVGANVAEGVTGEGEGASDTFGTLGMRMGVGARNAKSEGADD